MAKKWLLRLLALTMALVMLMCLCAWCIDPYMLYRVRDNQYLLNSRLVTPGLIKNYDYDTVLIGSSMIQNTDMQRFRDTLGGVEDHHRGHQPDGDSEAHGQNRSNWQSGALLHLPGPISLRPGKMGRHGPVSRLPDG